MKKFYLLALFVVLNIEVNAQNQSEEPYEFFIDVALNHGKEYTAAVAFTNDEKEWICDENGNKMKFKNKSNVINYFTKKGWTFVQINTYTISAGMSTAVSDYMLLKKCVKSEEEAKEGIKIESDFKKK
jgi:hypothetical protein